MCGMKIDSFELNTQAANRTVYFDYLRVFAIFAVIILHISASNWHTTDVNGFEWQVFNFFDSITRWCVPIFIMISGSLFLNRNSLCSFLYNICFTKQNTSCKKIFGMTSCIGKTILSPLEFFQIYLTICDFHTL